MWPQNAINVSGIWNYDGQCRNFNDKSGIVDYGELENSFLAIATTTDNRRWQYGCQNPKCMHLSLEIQIPSKFQQQMLAPQVQTRQLSYRKEDRAMRPIDGCPEKF